MIKHTARWRVRSFAALWIRTGPEGAQLRVWVQRQVICRESVGSLHVRFLSSKILGGNRATAKLRTWHRAPLLALETAQDALKTPQDASKTVQEASRTASRGLQDLPKTLKDEILVGLAKLNTPMWTPNTSSKSALMLK